MGIYPIEIKNPCVIWTKMSIATVFYCGKIRKNKGSPTGEVVGLNHSTSMQESIPIKKNRLDQWLSKSGPLTNSLVITQELARNAYSLAPPWTCHMGIWEWGTVMCLNKLTSHPGGSDTWLDLYRLSISIHIKWIY